MHHTTSRKINISKIPRWNLQRFLIEARSSRGDMFDYSLVTESDIKNKLSKITIKCNKCEYIFNPSIKNHIKAKTGCPQCAGKVKWSLEKFLIKAREIHNEKYNYDKIEQKDISNKKSVVTIACNICSYIWSTTVGAHIGSVIGCPDCAGHAPWTLERFLTRAIKLNGVKFDYTQIKSTDIVNSQSYIPIKCNTCDYQWSPSLANHIYNKSGCLRCSGREKWHYEKWHYEKFIFCAKKIHGDKYNYTFVTRESVENRKSKFLLKCNTCEYTWNTTIETHINSQCGCPRCAGRATWTLEFFIEKANEIHQYKFDYSLVTNEHIQGSGSRIPLKCNKCEYMWAPSIDRHINKKSGCPRCAGVAPWTSKSFIEKANKIHQYKYDYSYVTDESISGHKSKIILKCNTCKNIWYPTIAGHINSKSGCPCCSKSRGYSHAQINRLQSIMIDQNINIQYALSPEGEFKIPSVGKVDGYCAETNTVYEFHGDFWHGNPKCFDPDDINPVNKKTFGELFNKTIEKDNKIRENGFNLVVKWETD